MATYLTRNQLLNFLPSLTDEEVMELLAAANADADEGAEWLPYYKLALTRLIECCGILRAMVGRQNVSEAAKLYYQHLLFCGIGPRKEADVIRKVEEVAAGSMSDFIRGPSLREQVQASTYKCPHCGQRYSARECKPLVPVHDFEGKQCPGSQQNPRNAESDRRPLWKDEKQPETRYCDECERLVESERFTQVVEDEVCRQLCHRHFQE